LFTRRRKEIYEAIHPETRAHVAGAHASNKAQGNASAKLAPAFTSDTAKRTGQSERSVQPMPVAAVSAERENASTEWQDETEKEAEQEQLADALPVEQSGKAELTQA
jgi:hypothetical protein